MIKIDFSPPDTDEWNAWLVKCEGATTELIQRWESNEKVEIKNNLYKETKNSLFYLDAPPFYKKCVFCERRIARQHGDIEHYRPKKAVTDQNGVRVLAADGKSNHPGYFWLAYDWHNLLLSCTKCNQPWTDESGISRGKHNKFPVNGDYAFKPGDEALEDPLLLNPCIDDPSEHLEIDESGVLQPLTARGKVTVDILGLNDQSLVSLRNDAYKNCKRELLEQALDFLREKENSYQSVCNEIGSGSREFTFILKRALDDVNNRITELRAT